MLGAIDIAGAEVGADELFSTEHVQRQEAVMVIISMKEATNLVAVDRIVGRIKIQGDFLGRCTVRRDELIHKYLGDAVRPGNPPRLAGGRAL